MKQQVSQTLSTKCIMAQKFQTTVKQSWQEVERAKTEIDKDFAALVVLIETEKKKLIELLEEKQRAAERQAEEVLRQLQLEINEINQMSVKLEELLKTEDDCRLLQNFPSISPPSNTKHNFTVRVNHLLHAEMVRNEVAKMMETLNGHMENIIREVHRADKEETLEKLMQTKTKNVFHDELGKLHRRNEIKVTSTQRT